METEHKQKTIVIGGNKVQVDAKLAKLIKGLCKAEYYTALSCEDNVNDQVWICFFDWSANEMMRTMFTKHKKLYWYFAENAQWSVVWGEETKLISEDEVEGTGEIEVLHSLRFPKKDLRKVEKMFFEFFKKARK